MDNDKIYKKYLQSKSKKFKSHIKSHIVNWRNNIICFSSIIKYFFAYGSPNESLKLEQTSDIGLGAGYRGEIADIPLNAKYNFYHIAFKGKALQITEPEKANTPGYDYNGRQYIPIGESTYSGHELACQYRFTI
ncbi:MAG: hypothetical protein ISS81_02425 [Candidatus Marinimicrobia bacterium]|nr:hypothetical protein [Candidatus Neomarinimicrobiota bacterium]